MMEDPRLALDHDGPRQPMSHPPADAGELDMPGVALAHVWPPTLAASLRCDVEADVGGRGFSHVCQSPVGVVLLTAAERLCVWQRAGVHASHAYSAVAVRKRRRKWYVEACEPVPQQTATPAEPSEPADDASEELIASHEVPAEFAARVTELCERCMAVTASWGPIEPLSTAPAALGGAVGTAMLPAPPLERPAPLERAAAAPVRTERAVVMSVLAPVGYVRVESSDVLAPVRADAPVEVGTVVMVTPAVVSGREVWRLVPAASTSRAPEHARVKDLS